MLWCPFQRDFAQSGFSTKAMRNPMVLLELCTRVKFQEFITKFWYMTTFEDPFLNLPKFIWPSFDAKNTGQAREWQISTQGLQKENFPHCFQNFVFAENRICCFSSCSAPAHLLQLYQVLIPPRTATPRLLGSKITDVGVSSEPCVTHTCDSVPCPVVQ